MNAPAAPSMDFRSLIARGEGAQAVAFHLGGELHGCDIRLVEEVVTRRTIQPLPDMPPHLLGVLMLRGELVPVMDIAPALGLAPGRGGTPSVLVATMGEGRVGVAVDAVYEVLDVPAECVRPAPHTGGDRDSYLVCVARIDDKLVTLIDLAEILGERTTPDSADT
ncbi:MAG TPA: chemotaxis protein CheW [Longimicrobium sp.]|nr:chemotaxis protein CheW [Longimicrobium sp.]